MAQAAQARNRIQRLTHPERIEAETGVEVGVAPVRNEAFGAFIGGARAALGMGPATIDGSEAFDRGLSWALKRLARAVPR